jgi:hypothetical protein
VQITLEFREFHECFFAVCFDEKMNMIGHEAIGQRSTYRGHVPGIFLQKVSVVFVTAEKLLTAHGMVHNVVIAVGFKFFKALHMSFHLFLDLNLLVL